MRGEAPMPRLLLGLVCLAAPAVASAATTWTVCSSGCDFATMQSALLSGSVVSGDTLHVKAGTITESTGTVIMSKSLTITGDGASTTHVYNVRYSLSSSTVTVSV